MAKAPPQAVFRNKAMKEFLRHIVGDTNKITKQDRRMMNGYLSPVVFADVIDHFEKEEGPDGDWATWSVGYFEQLEKLGRQGNQILQFDGTLRQAFKPTKWKKTGSGVFWFNNAKTKSGFAYAGHHDEGASDGKKPRTFMWLSKKAHGKLAENLLSWTLREKAKNKK